MDFSFTEQLSSIRENYMNTLKKLISIEEEIEKTILYIKNLDEKSKEQAYAMYKNYLENLEKLRDEMTCLMKDNLFTLQGFWGRVNKEHQQAAGNLFSDSYEQFMKFMFDFYNPFKWINTEGKEERK